MPNKKLSDETENCGWSKSKVKEKLFLCGPSPQVDVATPVCGDSEKFILFFTEVANKTASKVKLCGLQ